MIRPAEYDHGTHDGCVAETLPFGNCATAHGALYEAQHMTFGCRRGALQKRGATRAMAGTFQDREKGFERKYQMDQDMEFRVHARRDKLLGLWLAEHFGLSGDDAKAYAIEVVGSNFEKPGDEDLIEKVMGDIAEKNAAIDEKELRAKFAALLHEAYDQINAG